MTKTQTRQTPQILNKRARFEYIILDRHEAGIALTGTEVKSLRHGRANLEGAYARIDGGEVWLVGCNISPYEAGNLMNHEPLRPRKLLLHRREIHKLTTRVTERGLTLIPTKIYFTDRGLIKVEVALAHGKSKADKREDLKTRDHQREMARATAGRF
jgi:SsrA-binding protein